MSNNLVKSIEANTVSIISNYILDSYASGFSILQELVQNACDADASQMVIKLYEKGMNGMCHPLLRNNPSVLIMNDGPFTATNDDAIGRLGVGSKGADSLSIGKFGLGMKSLFHWCDMFFYFTTDGKFRNAINPYADREDKDHYHDDWNYSTKEDAEKDFDLLTERAKEVAPGKRKPYFCILVPLRQDDGVEHVRQNYYAPLSIKELFTLRENDESVRKEEFCSSLQSMFATLYVSVSMKKTCRLSLIEMESSSETISCELNGPKGRITYQENGDANVAEFISIPGKADTGGLAQIIKGSSSWPKSKVSESGSLDKTVAQRMDENDCSLIFIKTLKTDVPFQISWASYLPLKETNEVLKASFPTDHSFNLIVNGSFAIDSGRNHIIGYKKMFLTPLDVPQSGELLKDMAQDIDNQEDIGALWNSFLFQNVLAPRIPFVLDKARKDLSLNQDFDNLLHCFESGLQSDWFRKIRRIATRDNFLAPTLVGKKTDWVVMESNKPVVPFPAPSPSLFEEPLFTPFLDVLCHGEEEQIVVLGSHYSYYDEDNVKNAWKQNPQKLTDVFQAVTDEKSFPLFQKAAYLNFLDELFSAVPFHEMNGASCVRFVKQSLVHFYYEKETLDNVPNAFKIKLIPTLQKRLLEIQYPSYFIPCKTIGPSVFFDSWMRDDRFVLLPDDTPVCFSGNKIEEFIEDFKKLLSSNRFTDIEVGQLFEDCVVSYLPRATLDARLSGWVKNDFSEYSVIPVYEYSYDSPNGKNKTYIHWKDVDSLYSFPEVNQQKGITALFDFAPQVPARFAINNDVKRRFGITVDLHDPSLSSLVVDCLKNYQGTFHPEKAENLLKFLLKDMNCVKRLIDERIEVFPTTDGGVTSLGPEDVFIDVDGFLPKFHPKSDFSALVEVSSPQMRDTYKNYTYFSQYILIRQNVLSYYLQQIPSAEIDEKIVFRFIEASHDEHSLSRLKTTPWFQQGDRKYSGDQIIDASSSGINKHLSDWFGKTCLIIDSSQKQLVEKIKSVIVTDISKVSPATYLSVFHDAFPLMDGDTSNTPKGHVLELLIGSLKLLDEKNVMNGWGYFLEKRMKDPNVDYCALNRELPNRNKDFIASTCLQLLKITSQGKQPLEENTIEVFSYICRVIVHYGIVLTVDDVKDLRFPSEASTWENLDSLCDYTQNHNLDKRHLLNHSIPMAFLPRPTMVKEDYLNEDTLVSIPDLQKIWPNLNQNLLAMLLFITRKKEYRDFATNKLGSETVCIQYLHGVQIHKSQDYWGNQSQDGWSDYSHLPVEQLFSLKTTVVLPKIPTVRLTLRNTMSGTGSENKHKVQSILGNELVIEQANDAKDESAFISKKDAIWETSYYLRSLVGCDENTTNKCILNLMNDIVEYRYIHTFNFYSIRDLLLQNQQTEMQISQKDVCDRIDTTLGSLNIGRNDQIGKGICDKLNEITELQHDKNSALYRDNTSSVLMKFGKDIDVIKEDLIKEIENNISVRGYILSAVKRKLQNAQYDARKVPFEFFQNADDAIIQRISYDSDFSEKNNFYYSLVGNGDSITIEHNGRPINYCPSDNQHREWKRDLSNMLTFGMSTKQQETGNSKIEETGKFGLGFKSCYFLTDSPQIESGSLVTQIYGGVYPANLPCSMENMEGKTSFYLSLSQEGKDKEESVLDSFEEQIPGLLLFAKQINIILFNTKKVTKIVEWRKGKRSVVLIDSRRFLVLEFDCGYIAFALKGDIPSFTQCDGKLSKLWLVTPLGKPEDDPGYLVDSPDFSIDIGRDQLAFNTETNQKIAESLGDGAGLFLIDVYHSSPSFEGRVKVGESACAKLLDIMTEKHSPIFDTIFEKSYNALVHDTHCIYSGFDFFEDVTSRLKCILLIPQMDGKLTVKQTVKCFHGFLKKIGKDKEFLLVGRGLFVLPENKNEVKTITTIHEFLASAIGEEEISVMLFSCIIEILSSVGYDVNKYIEERMACKCFLAKDGEFHTLDSLVSLRSELFEIAPLGRRLDPQYHFDHDDTHIDDDTKVSWINLCKDDARVKALEYLAKNAGLCWYFRNCETDSWVMTDYMQYKTKLHGSAFDELYRQLCSDDKISFGPSPLIVKTSPYSYIKKVYDSWDAKNEAQKQHAIEEYRANLFGIRTLDLSSGYSKDWFRLLYIAGLLGLGRVIQSANITFVENFMQLPIFQEKPLDYPKEWMEHIILDQMHYTGDYEYWRRYMPYFAQISYCAKDLYHLFTSEVPCAYSGCLDFSNNESSSGTDYEMPNLSHTLKRYYPIILRELLMSGSGKLLSQKIRDAQLKESFYPNKDIRESLQINDKDGQDKSSLFYDRARIDHPGYVEKYGDYPFHVFEMENKGNNQGWNEFEEPVPLNGQDVEDSQ